MRLWHYKLIPFLPRSQLIAQWRELNSIFKNQPNHILINYVYDYPKYDLEVYSSLVVNEMVLRGYKITRLSYSNFEKCFGTTPTCFAKSREEFHKVLRKEKPFPKEHNDEYLAVCYFNLLEKCKRGQRDFPNDWLEQMWAEFGPTISKYVKEQQ